MAMPEAELISCRHCGATNRVAADKNLAGKEAVCGRCKKPLPHDLHPLIVTDANFASVVEQSRLPVLLDIWAPWCGPCRAVGPVIESLAKELAGKVRVAKLNTDENPAVSSRFQIQSIPALLIFQKGEEIDRIVGAVPRTEILRRLEQALG